MGARSPGGIADPATDILPDSPVRAHWRGCWWPNTCHCWRIRDFNKLKRQLHCDDEMLKAVTQLVASLNPRLAVGFGRYRHPVYCRRCDCHHGAEAGAQLNPAAMPKLR